MELNAFSGGRRYPANVQEKQTFSINPRAESVPKQCNLASNPSSLVNLANTPSAGIQWGGRVGLSSVPHGKLVAYKSYISVMEGLQLRLQ